MEMAEVRSKYLIVILFIPKTTTDQAEKASPIWFIGSKNENKTQTTNLSVCKTNTNENVPKSIKQKIVTK